MRRWIKQCILILTAFCMIRIDCLFVCAVGETAETVSVSAASCIVIEAVTGEILYEKNAYEERPMASTTKIMSALLCLESGDLDTEFVVDANAIQVEGSSMGLVEGDIVTKRTLCYGMLLPSGNDAAGAAAVRIAGNYEAFADRMNAKAEELGMTQTHFVTPSGLHDNDHYSTAYDMAILTAAALQNPDFCEICSQPQAQVCFGNPPYERWLTNSNKLLTMDDTIIGVKTGFTDEAGRCLVSACQRDGVTLICVTLYDPNDWQDHLTLYDTCFAQIQPIEIPLPSDWTIAVTGGDTDCIPVTPDVSAVIVGTQNGSAPELTFQTQTQPFLYAPVTSGEAVGVWTASLDDRIVAKGTLYAAQDAPALEQEDEPEQESSWLQRIRNQIRSVFQKLFSKN